VSDDTKRIEWLEAHPFTAYRHRDPGTRKVTHAVVVDEDRGATSGRTGVVKPTLRAAIDAAMEFGSGKAALP